MTDDIRDQLRKAFERNLSSTLASVDKILEYDGNPDFKIVELLAMAVRELAYINRNLGEVDASIVAQTDAIEQISN